MTTTEKIIQNYKDLGFRYLEVLPSGQVEPLMAEVGGECYSLNTPDAEDAIYLALHQAGQYIELQ